MAEKKYILVKVEIDTHTKVKEAANREGMLLQRFVDKALLKACKAKQCS